MTNPKTQSTQPAQKQAEQPTMPCKIARYKYSAHVNKGDKIPISEYERLKSTGINVDELFEK